MEKKKKKISWGNWIMTGFFGLIGFGCGILMMDMAHRALDAGMRRGVAIAYSLGIFAWMYVSVFLQIVAHEAGHLVFGLATGYGFSSFRIGSFMWVKEHGKIRFRRMSLAGTAGQCLLVPPELVDGKIPYVLYNLGGCIVNLVLSLVLAGLCLVFPRAFVWLLVPAIVGVAFALSNGIPLSTGGVDNDGKNALSLGKNPAALRSFYIQMKSNELIAKGIRLKDMEPEWFVIPDDGEMKNSMVATLGVLACNRLLDAHAFVQAEAEIQRLLALDSGIVGMHRSLLTCDRMYCLLLSGDVDAARSLRNKELEKFLRAMKTFPTVLRLEYTWALLGEKDEKKATAAEQRFQKFAARYPYPSEITGERELLDLAREAQTAQ